jgi:signal transduction histidine kinase/ligand-binding sensor domain-containing protein/DNA-binding response OmpR family regulator
MKMSFGKHACFILCFYLLNAYSLFASGYPISTYLGIDQGLSNNSVRCIYQDHHGFMWFGTYDGLNRFDGYEFETFRNNFKNNRSLINNWINAINEDTKGNLWIGTRQGACIYQSVSNSFSPVLYYTLGKKTEKLVSVIKGIETDRQGNMFVATADLGLLFFPEGATLGYTISLDNDPKLQYDVSAVKFTKDNKIWMVVVNKGLYLYDYKTRTAKLVNGALKSASCIGTTTGYLWMGSNDGLSRYNISLNSFDKTYNEANKKLSYNKVAGITADNNDELWIATDGGGLVILNTKSDEARFLSNTNERNSLSSNAVYSIWIDQQSRKWIGTLRGGINVIDPNKERFQTIVSSPGTTNTLISNYILSFYEAPNNDLWIGTDGGGLSIWDRKLNRFTNYHHEIGNPFSLSDNFVTDIKCDVENNIWISTYRGGVNRFSNGKFEHYACVDASNPTVLLNPLGLNLFEDAEKNLWLSSLQYGLFKLNRQKKVFQLFNDQLKDLLVLKEDRNHILWTGDLSHLIQIDKASKKHLSYFIGKPVRAVLEDHLGNFWIGTEGGGLILFDRKKGKMVARYSTDDGLCSNSILNILEDAEGNLWMSTYEGLAKFNSTNKTFKNYYQSDGVQSNQFNYNAALKLRSGEFVFGGIRGFTLFRPESITPVKGSPKTFITGIRIANNSVEETNAVETKMVSNRIERIKVPYNKAIFSFEFAALEYSSPDKIQYAYYLEGWDRGWNYSGNIRKVVYTHLSEGTYIFRVKSTNTEGQWNKDEVRIAIVILPPWYRSWWAYLIYAMITGASVYFFLQYRARQTKLRYEVKIAKLSAENERSERQRSQAELEKEKFEREKQETELALEKAEKEKSLAELAVEKAELEKERAEREREHAELEKERILNEKEREIHEKKISFFTSISHEFRTPLTLIINPVKDLLKKNADEQIRNDGELNIVYRNARRMLSLVDQLLLFRKAESGLDKIRPSELNIHDLAYEVYLCFVQQARSRSIDYIFDCPNKALRIYADSEKLEIILYNLLSNALKYTPAQGKIKLTINDRAGNVVIEVEDNGSGIPSGTGEKLFDKFYKAERTKTSSKTGFGIGLFLVKHFAEQHGGSISYQSQEGHGATFILTLQKGTEHFAAEVIISETDTSPAYIQMFKEEPLLEENIQPKKSITEVISEKKSILIIDDDEPIRQYLARIFKDNYLIHQAEDGTAGLKAAQKYLPDLIISDIHMQGLNGIELCKAVKENEQLSHIPVILLTGATSDELKLRGIEGGADDYIVKPFDSQLLIARVTNLLKARNTLQKYFYNEITLNKSSLKISPEYKQFLDKCISIVESHLEDEDFSVNIMLSEMGMSHSNLFRKVKSVSGQSVNVFIRFIRLRKAAELFINTNHNVNETAFMVGINDVKYFREQFNKLFGMNPSDYIKKYRKVHGKQYTVNKDSINPES